MRNRVWHLRLDRKCSSAVCASSYAAATARFQSVQPLYLAATDIHAHHAYNTKRRSRLCGYLAGEWTLTAYGRSLSPTNIRRKNPLGPSPGPLWSRSPSAGILFLLLLAFRIWLWLRLAARMGRILVPNVALFVTEALFGSGLRPPKSGMRGGLLRESRIRFLFKPKRGSVERDAGNICGPCFAGAD
jgi:hypothetical protein